MAKKKIDVMITAFRDGFQSVYGARVKTKDFIPAVEKCRDIGIRHFEAGGGARFQALYFYCNEDAFDMMDTFREAAGHDANLQTLARGINVVALDSQPKDMINLHAKMFKKHGITTIRNFDALNDVNNLAYSGRCIVDNGLNHEITITMMDLPPGCSGAHDIEFYINTLKKILDADIPFHSLCFKDASGTSNPTKVYNTIKKARQMIPSDVKISFHTHSTAGIGPTCYLAALNGGADQIDLSLSPCSGGTAQPDALTMYHILIDTDFDLGFDILKILEVEEIFKLCMKDYFLPPEAVKVEPMIQFYPMPGGALTANTQMMRDNNIMDRYSEVIASMGEAVKRGGFGTSVTPVSQFYFQQAFNNVFFGKWKKIAEGYGKMVLGYFGKTPVEPDPEIVKIASEQLGLPPTKENPLDINERDPKKGIKAAKNKLKEEGLPETEENIFIVGACGAKGVSFLKGEMKENIRYRRNTEKDAEQAKKDTKPSAVAGRASEKFIVTVEGKEYKVQVKTDTGEITSVAESDEKEISASLPSSEIRSPIVGVINKILVEAGQKIKKGETLLIIEAMKMESEIKADKTGIIGNILVNEGDSIKNDQPLLTIA